MTWRLMVVCSVCGFVAASGHVDESTTPTLNVTTDCPRCESRRGPQSGAPSRFKLWRETRKFRRQLRKLG